MSNQKANNIPLQEFNTWYQNAFHSSSGTANPVEKFTLSFTGPPIWSPELGDFNELCGRHIKSLELQISDLESKEQGSDAANKFFTTVRSLLENVKTLHVKLADRKNDENYLTTTYIFKSIFSTGSALTTLKRLRLTLTGSIDFILLEKFPAMQELVLRAVYDDNDPGKFTNLFTHLSAIRRIQIQTRPDFLNLKILDTIGVPKDSLRSLIAAKLTLEHLALSLTSQVADTELKQCLNEYEVTLKSLKLLRCKIRDCNPFPSLPLSVNFENLEVMELWGNVVTRLEFLTQTPKLVKLKINYYCFECPYYSGRVSDGPNVFQVDMAKNSSDLKKGDKQFFGNLEVFDTDSMMSSVSWDELRIWMPNLRVVEAPIPNNLVLLDLFDNFPLLEVLRLRFGSEVDDGGFVGGGMVQDGSMVYTRGITKLKSMPLNYSADLRSFELEVECGQGKLTDKSAKLGFLKLERLDTLKLGFTGKLLTEEIEMILREKVKTLEMYRSCSKISEGEKVERCCKWADFKLDWNIS